MQEIDFIRQQLAAERAHLREILRAVSAEPGPVKLARPVTTYIEWASRRLLEQLSAHRTALQAEPKIGPGMRAQLAAIEAAAARSLDTQPTDLLALLATWSEPLEALAGATLRISHWRQVAPLSADTILEERQLYGAARSAAGLT